jgi:DNA-binding LytR/AlgR family response regulator
MKETVKILIVEDEPLIADDLAFILEDEGYEVIGKAIDFDEAKELLKQKPDLVLLDISLDGDEDGIEVAQYINEKYQIPFIFVTSHSDKLTINRVKKTNPCGFIVKPFKASEIRSGISIVLYKNKQKNVPKPKNMSSDSFFIKIGYDLVKIKYDDINYIKAEDNYTTIFMDNEDYLASMNLKSIAGKLPENQFLRIHRSYIINIKKIDRISHRFVYINGSEVPVGKNHYQKLQEFINML